MVGQAVAEFEFSLTFAEASIDKYARGNLTAMSEDAKKGANVFFGKVNCVTCHAVAGKSNEMFSDFRSHDAGGPFHWTRQGLEESRRSAAGAYGQAKCELFHTCLMGIGLSCDLCTARERPGPLNCLVHTYG